MNLLLLEPHELSASAEVCLTGRRAKHAFEVLGANEGDSLRVGVRGGKVGTATVLRSDADAIELRVVLTDEPPARPGVDLILAVPRPKALKKVLPAIASLGVDRLVLVNAARVEKSYFGSKVLEASYRDELLTLGLEQARDTVPPELLLRERLRPFVEDEVPGLFADSRRFLAHPTARDSMRDQVSPSERHVVAIGPEGGWVPFELELFVAAGFVPVELGSRILRVETVVPYILGQLVRRGQTVRLRA